MAVADLTGTGTTIYRLTVGIDPDLYGSKIPTMPIIS